MPGVIDGTPHERDLWLEQAVLAEIVSRYPARLSTDELALRMQDAPSDTDRAAVEDRLQELMRSGLIRIESGVVEPTHAAVRAAEVFGT